MMPAPILVFDLDGTLVDTAPDLIDTLNLVFTREGLPAVNYATARNLIGGGVKPLIVRGLETEGRVLAEAEIDRMFADFLAHYTAHIADRSRPFPGLVEALDALEADGYRFAVCTNKYEKLSVLLLEQLKLTGRFDFICGQDTFGMHKPDPEVLRRTIAAANGDPARSVMIGDSLTDIRTARAFGIPVVAVDFGYSELPIAEHRPDRIIDHFSELPAVIAALAASR